jgi:hypothetical protein
MCVLLAASSEACLTVTHLFGTRVFAALELIGVSANKSRSVRRLTEKFSSRRLQGHWLSLDCFKFRSSVCASPRAVETRTTQTDVTIVFISSVCQLLPHKVSLPE